LTGYNDVINITREPYHFRNKNLLEGEEILTSFTPY